ncbi:TetR/AcrR family transcriptional regulator [Bradyrhizobium liaoningense]|uniref:TetR/AcrR family transcriptional regulator n=1 Tax=Bradyrhizobium liaoningense TaxID=43992 RepID=UPI001BAC02B9|nr:TetR/AcrR family transcriptional regulator [Bradyrhizobium liaoningense]MBR0852909.1 TetR family transcriptional regulator [Bradyrhizobium liaoningense]
MKDASERPEGRRESKRRETSERIIEKGLKLFVKNGYEGTTLDAIAAAAGISRRTFFYYFRSKEDVLLAAHDSGFRDALKPAMREESPDQAPLDAVQKCLVKLASRYETKESIVFDRLMQSTEALRARKEAVFVDTERILLEAMCELWPSPGRRDGHRLVAMVAMGTLRLALDKWKENDAAHPLAHYVRQSFTLLKKQF